MSKPLRKPTLTPLKEVSKAEAQKNTTVSKKSGREAPVVLKTGIPLDHAVKHSPYEDTKFGMSKGLTKNMDNYESLRIDVWLTSQVQEGETLKEAFSRVEEVIDEVLEESVIATAGEL